MRHALIGLLLTAATLVATPATAAVNVSIGINVPAYPSLVQIPSYPVYYAPSLRANYFFYDGLYWVFNDGTWYESTWYNGPWYAVDPFDVPVFLLRVPVRYYRAAPAFFHGWAYDRPPRWGDHWGSSWSSRRGGWDRWNRSSAPAAAPLPAYQRSYSGSRYPSVTQQAAIQTRSYSYQPRDTVARQQFQQRRAEARAAPAPQQAQRSPVQRAQVQQQQRQERVQQTQVQRQERAQQAQVQRAQQAQQAQAQRAQQAQQAQAQRAQAQQQRQEHAQAQQQQRQERQQQHENRGQDKEKGKGRDRNDNG